MKPPKRPFVAVVSGLPRSGTSPTMQMLRAGGMPILTDERRPPDADNPRGYLEYEPVKRTAEDASWVACAQGRAVKVVHTLLRHLPAGREYRVLLMERPLDEVMASQRAMLERGGEKVEGDDAELGAVMARQLEEAEAWLRGSPHCRVLRVRYLDLIESPGRIAAEIDRFLGGGLDTNAMLAAVDPILYRHRGSGPKS